MAAPMFMLIAGETSGDLLGADLMRELRSKCPEATFFGVGGEHMQKEGLVSLFPMEELSLMGIVEVLPHIPNILKRQKLLQEEAAERRPDILITIDCPDFSLRVAKHVKAHLRIPCVHYVSPSVWAWKKKRVYKMAKFLDHVLALFPFEPLIYQKANLDCTFVGHPLAQRLKPFMPKKVEAPKNQTLALMPGSRKGEIDRCLPAMIETYNKLKQNNPKIDAVMPLAHEKHLAWVKPHVQNAEDIQFITGDAKFKALAKCRAALVTSGTANLELAMLGLPMVVCYAMNNITYMLAKLLVKVPYISPVNWVAGKRVVPEFVQEHLNLNNLYGVTRLLLTNDDEWERQATQLEFVRHALLGGKNTPAQNAAKVVFSYLPSIK